MSMNRLARFGRALAVGTLAIAATLSTTQVADAEPTEAVEAAAPAPPSVPTAIQVPAGNKVFLVGHATGFQIYTCNGTAWALPSTPDAKLFGDNGKLVATHFGGPTWQARDGSTVVGALPPAASSPSPAPNAIPWLLLAAKSTAAGPDGDRFVKTTYIQRVATSGGVAPAADKCTTAGQVAKVSYTADYYFWKKTGRDK
jgi:Protein of unknown function (DUF3455)